MTVSKTKKKFTFDVGWVFSGSVFILLLHFFQKPLLARYLGPSGLGLFSMTLTIVSIFEMIAMFGIDASLVKFVAESKGKGQKERVYSFFSSAAITILITGIISSLILFALSDSLAGIFNMPLLSNLLKIYSFALPFSLMHGIIISYFNGIREMKYYSIIRILQAIFVLLFIIVLFIMGFGIKGAIIGTSLAIITIVIIEFTIIKKSVNLSFFNYNENSKKLLSFGGLLFAANLMGYLYVYVDTLLIGYFLTSTDVGYYDTATSLGRFFLSVPNAIGIVAYPVISEYWAIKNLQSINKMVDKAAKYSAIILTFFGLMIVFFSNDIIILLFTKEFLPAVLPLRILIIGTIISGTLKSIGPIFASAERPDLIIKTTVVGAIGTILLNVILIPKYGIFGAAMATTIATVVYSIVAIFLLSKVLTLKFQYLCFVKITLIAGISASLFYLLNSVNHYLSAIIALFFYAIFIMNYIFDQEDRNFFNNTIKHLINSVFIKKY